MPRSVALLGFDTEGKASYEYYSSQGDEITICDQNPGLTLPEGAHGQLGPEYLNGLDRFDVLVRTAGMPPHVISDAAPDVMDKVTTHVAEFMHASSTRNIIGVTGTKGKGTTSSLITAILRAHGKDAHLGGNIGVPPLTFLSDLTPDSWVVLELSSFQLMDLPLSPHIAVCLMVVPEHLNWHAGMAEYTGAKANLFAHQDADDIAIYFGENDVSREIAAHGDGQKVPYYMQPGAYVTEGYITIDDYRICATSELGLLGEHNWQNACAAVTAVWQAGFRDADIIRRVLQDFRGLEHRLELVSEVGGVRYYNDSFGTTPETAIVALRSFSVPKVIVLGGSDKGASYDELARTVAGTNVRKVLLIGDQAPRIQAALMQADFHDFMPGGSTMKEIVATICSEAQPGDVALLSPACASFDMFRDYKDRGTQFKQAVQALSAAA